MVSLKVSGADQVFSNQTTLYFSEEGTSGLDPIDAPKLTPAGLSNTYLSFYSVDEDGRSYALQSLPLDVDEKLPIPLDIKTTQPGNFTLDWSLPESHIFSGSYFLRDNETGDVIELREGSDYRFEITGEEVLQAKEAESTYSMSDRSVQPADRLSRAGIPLGERSDGSTPRFELLIAQSGIDGFTELGAVPDNFELGQNYPNPFNPTTVISYQLPANSKVRLEVYDMLGRNVATLVSGQVSAGRHTINFDAGNLSSGVYLYRLQAGSQIMTRKLTVVK